MNNNDHFVSIKKQIKELKHQLDVKTEIIRAITTGDADTFTVKVEGKEDQIFSLKNVEHLYRIIVESMFEGAISFVYDGTILYCNKQFSIYVDMPIAQIIGTSIYQYIPDNQHSTLHEFIESTDRQACRLEFLLQKNKVKLNVYFSARKLQLGSEPAICVAVTDLTELKENETALHSAIINLKTSNTELNQALIMAKEADRAKSEFLANMSHELRSPLNAIIGFTELMHNGKVGPISPQHKDYMNEVLTSARHLLALINQVLDLSSIEIRKIALNPERVSLQQLTQDVINDFELPLAKKQIHLKIHIDPTLDNITLDPVRFKQAFYNYLSNAIKFTPETGQISVTVNPENDTCFRLAVKDTGIGIHDKDICRLFKPFQQLDSGAAKEYQGSGLGLALTKNLIEAQGGKVGVTSTFGKGSIFYFTLPRIFQSTDKNEIIK